MAINTGKENTMLHMIYINIIDDDQIEVTVDGTVHKYVFSWGQDDPREGAIFAGCRPVGDDGEFDVRLGTEEPGAWSLANQVFGLDRYLVSRTNKKEVISGVKINWISGNTIEFDLYDLTYRFMFFWGQDDPEEGATLVGVRPLGSNDVHRLSPTRYAVPEAWLIADEAFGISPRDAEPIVIKKRMVTATILFDPNTAFFDVVKDIKERLSNARIETAFDKDKVVVKITGPRREILRVESLYSNDSYVSEEWWE